MPDAQGTASFIGEFLKGYMGQAAELQDQKMKKVAGILDMADQYHRMAQDATLEETYNEAQTNYQTKVAEADKVWNQKSGNLGSIMKIFGFGKKGPDGNMPVLPRGAFQSQGAPIGPVAAMPRSESLGPAPPPTDVPNAGGEFQPGSLGYLALQQSKAPAPGTPAQVGPVANAHAPAQPWVHPLLRNQMEMRRMEREQDQEWQLKNQEKIGEIQRRFSREDFDWKQGQTQAETDRKVQAYKDSPQYQQDSPDEQTSVLNYLQFGIPIKPQQMRIKSEIVRNENNQLVNRTTDLVTGKVVQEEPYQNTSDEPYLQAIIQSGRANTPEEARAILGQARLDSLNLGNQAKKGSIANQASLIEARNERTKYLALKKAGGGKLTAAQAVGLYKAAQSHGLAMLKLKGIDVLVMPKEQLQIEINKYAQPYVEGTDALEGLMKWEELRQLAGMEPGRTPQQNAVGFGQGIINKQNQTATPAPAAKPGALPK